MTDSTPPATDSSMDSASPDLPITPTDPLRPSWIPASAIAVCLYDKPERERTDEFKLLVESAGHESVALMVARLYRTSPATFMTSGKLATLIEGVQATGAQQIYIDTELSGIQLRNLQRETQVNVADRTGLILNIFAQRARSQTGKLQVELARLNYLATHLVREWSHLERQRGGLGKTGGPGEKQIELDRRLIAEKIKKLKTQLATIAQQRQSQRKARARRGAFTLALVGYTNAGKSTLFNRLTGAHSLAKNQLFASLDPMARRCYIPALPPNQNVVALDTVGFIRALPHDLIEAFHATLEETRLADLLLIVADSNDPQARERLRDVEEVLESIGSADIPRLLVWNKADLLTDVPRQSIESADQVSVSALTGLGIHELQEKIAQKIESANSKTPPS